MPSVNIDVRGQPTPHQPRRWSQSHGLGDHGRSERLGLARRQASAACALGWMAREQHPRPGQRRCRRLVASEQERHHLIADLPRTCPTAAKLTAHQVVHRQWTARLSAMVRRTTPSRRSRAANARRDDGSGSRKSTRPPGSTARRNEAMACPSAVDTSLLSGSRSRPNSARPTICSVSVDICATCRRCATRAPRRR